MTETATYGDNSARQPAFVNGSTPIEHGLSRKPVKKDPGLGIIRAPERRAADAGTRAGTENAEATLPLLELPGVNDTLRLWHGSCAASYRLTEIIWSATGAVTAAHLARARAATERAIATGRAIAAADRATRTELAWGYLHESLDHTLAGAIASLDLAARPAREILELLAQPAADDSRSEPDATDRAA